MDGIILVKKEKNMTSHDVVNKMRRILNTKKVGHSGTLDPNVEGVLCIFVNKATKAIQFMEDKTKQYHGVMSFGSTTTTEDSDGEVVESCEVALPLDETKLKAIFNSFLGVSKQIPPMISSVKVNGKKLYEYYREGIEVERPIREIEITNFELLSIHDNEVEFVVDCSSGTYIRTLCVDVANKYGTLGHMKELVRTRVGAFNLENCSTLAEISEGHFKVLSIKEALSGMKMIEANEVVEKRVLQGKTIFLNGIKEDVVLICKGEEALAVYKRSEENTYCSERGLW